MGGREGDDDRLDTQEQENPPERPRYVREEAKSNRRYRYRTRTGLADDLKSERRGSSLAWRRRRTRATCETRGGRKEETGWRSAALYYIIIPPDVHAPSGSGLTSAPDGGADPSVSDVALADDAAVGGASRCAVEPGLSSSWIFRHSAPPSERTGHPRCQPSCVSTHKKGVFAEGQEVCAGAGGMGRGGNTFQVR